MKKNMSDIPDVSDMSENCQTSKSPLCDDVRCISLCISVMDGEPRPPLRPHGEAPYVVTGALYVEAVKFRTQMNSGMLQIAAGMLWDAG